MLKKNFFLKIFPVFLLFVGFFLGFLPLCLHNNNGKNIFWDTYIILQMLIWFNLGIILKKSYIAVFTDDLTKLWNRRYLHIKLGSEIKKMKGRSALSLAIIDIDNFKRINDNYGHLFGDKVLAEVAYILRNNVRKSDTVGRWGGEEFIIILPNSDEGGAKVVFDRIRQIIERYDFGCRITISGGIAFIQERIETEKLIEKADSALYQAKRKKNMIAIYEE